MMKVLFALACCLFSAQVAAHNIFVQELSAADGVGEKVAGLDLAICSAIAKAYKNTKAKFGGVLCASDVKEFLRLQQEMAMVGGAQKGNPLRKRLAQIDVVLIPVLVKDKLHLRLAHARTDSGFNVRAGKRLQQKTISINEKRLLEKIEAATKEIVAKLRKVSRPHSAAIH